MVPLGFQKMEGNGGSLGFETGKDGTLGLTATFTEDAGYGAASCITLVLPVLGHATWHFYRKLIPE